MEFAAKVRLQLSCPTAAAFTKLKLDRDKKVYFNPSLRPCGIPKLWARSLILCFMAWESEDRQSVLQKIKLSNSITIKMSLTWTLFWCASWYASVTRRESFCIRKWSSEYWEYLSLSTIRNFNGYSGTTKTTHSRDILANIIFTMLLHTIFLNIQLWLSIYFEPSSNAGRP